MSAATGQACNGTFDPSNTREIVLAIWTSVKVSVSTAFHRKGKIMTTFLPADSKIATSLLPFSAVRQNLAAPGAKLRQNMR